MDISAVHTVDYILEYISENLSFDNEEQLNVFIKELNGRIKDLPKCTTFIRVTQTTNEVYQRFNVEE